MNTSGFLTPNERLDTFFDPAQPRTVFEDAQIDQIAHLLKCSGQDAASRCPRTCIVLRIIDQLDILGRLFDNGFDDHLFPIHEGIGGLPIVLDPRIKQQILQWQHLILTKSVYFEQNRHCHFGQEEPLPFEIGDRLGSGSYGDVSRVVSKISHKDYALKRIRRRAAFGNKSHEAVKQILREIGILKIWTTYTLSST